MELYKGAKLTTRYLSAVFAAAVLATTMAGHADAQNIKQKFGDEPNAALITKADPVAAQKKTQKSGDDPNAVLVTKAAQSDVDRRIVRMFGPIDWDLANDVSTKLRALDQIDPGHKPITLIITSPGGEDEPTDMIFNTIHTGVKSRVNTVCNALCASNGAFLLATGTGERSALPRADIMIHEGTLGISGKHSDVDAEYAYQTRLQRVYEEALSQYTGQSMQKLHDIMKTDKYMTPDEALALGLIDRIEQPLHPPPRPATP